MHLFRRYFYKKIKNKILKNYFLFYIFHKICIKFFLNDQLTNTLIVAMPCAAQEHPDLKKPEKKLYIIIKIFYICFVL